MAVFQVSFRSLGLHVIYSKSSKIWIISGWFLLSRRYIFFYIVFLNLCCVVSVRLKILFKLSHIYCFTMTCSQFLSKQFLLIRNYVLPCNMLIMVISFKIALKFVIWILLLSNLQYTILRTPELVGLAHHFCASFCLYSSKFREKNQIKINLMKHGMCNIHINDYYSKYFV